MSSKSRSSLIEEFKAKGNANFQKGQIEEAKSAYTSGIEKCVKILSSPSPFNDSSEKILYPTLLSNRSMCHLKQFNVSGTKTSLQECVDDCTVAIEYLDKITFQSKEDDAKVHTLRSKILYRRAKARDSMVTITDSDASSNKECLNQAAQDLLQLLSFDKQNRQASALLRSIRTKHGMSQVVNTPIAKCLQTISSLLKDTEQSTDSLVEKEGDSVLMNSLKGIMGSIVHDASSSSIELGRRGGVNLIMAIATQTNNDFKCRTFALNILSAASSHKPFVLDFARYIDQQKLAHLVAEACATNSESPSGSILDVAAAAISLTLRLCVYLLDETSETVQGNQLIDGASICRMCNAALSSKDIRCQRSALDLLAAWTATDLDSLAEAANAADIYTDDSTKNAQSRKNMGPSEEEIHQMKPRELAAYKKNEYKRNQRVKNRAKKNTLLFCDEETGGLSTLLSSAIQTDSSLLRREFISTFGRFIAQLEENEIKKLVSPFLGWKKGINKNWDEKEEESGPIIEEIFDEDEENEKLASSNDNVDSAANYTNEINEKKQNDLNLIRGIITTALLLGKGEVGTWALAEGWSNGNSVSEITKLATSDNPRSMSIASEVLCAAASVEKARPYLTPLLQSQSLMGLLKSDDKDIRSGAAAAMAKLGLANKESSDDEGELFGLLEVAAGLLEESDEISSEKGVDDEHKKKTQKVDLGKNTSVDRAVELLSYLSSKTLIKEEIAHGFKASIESSKTVLEEVVDLASQPNAGGSVYGYGISSIFAYLAVSNEQLRKEAFEGKEISAEQYDQLQSLGKTEEEKELAKENVDEDPAQNVSLRIQKMASANVPRAMVKLIEGASETTLEQIFTAMNRMTVEASVRGKMVQQGCLSECIKMSKGKNPSQLEKKIIRTSQHCIAKMLVTTNPSLLTLSQRMGSIRPLIQLIRDNDASDLQIFESLLSMTNLASVGDETKNRIVAEKGLSALNYTMFSEHEMVRRAATEAMSNMIPHPDMLEHLADSEKLRLWVAFATDYEEHFECARAAAGCLAMATQYNRIATVLASMKNFDEMCRTLIQCGNLELMHRVMVILLNMTEHGDECLTAVKSTGSDTFCDGYIQSYHNGDNMNALNFSASDKELMNVTIDLAKEIVQRCR